MIEAADRRLNLLVLLLAVVFWKTTPGEILSNAPRHLRCAAQVVFTKDHVSKLVEGRDPRLSSLSIVQQIHVSKSNVRTHPMQVWFASNWLFLSLD